MNDMVVSFPLSRVEVTRSRAYKKNDQASVEPEERCYRSPRGGLRRFEGIDGARSLARLFDAARLHVNFFQPSFKLNEKHREGAKVIKRYLPPATPYETALVDPDLNGVQT
ncbi:hypothetical protein [Bradyrhizobium sp. STM 3561]|uniref:hypothetical protein n=1 Tax=Bradyrhizobium sp. STM 3561 TaxID=578923 RepID=UPI00388E22F9